MKNQSYRIPQSSDIQPVLLMGYQQQPTADNDSPVDENLRTESFSRHHLPKVHIG